MFVLVTLVGYAAWWVQVQLSWIRDRQTAMQWALREARGVAGIAVGDFPKGMDRRALWQLRMLGDNNEFGQVLFDRTQVEQAAHFRELFPEMIVRIR